MTQASRDQNHVTSLLGILYSDGVTLVPIAIDGSGHVKTDTTNTISFTPPTISPEDENFVNVLMGVDSTDPTKLCPVYVNSSGAILIGT
jgi:hypothetical protein